jgi:hypothetical protein
MLRLIQCSWRLVFSSQAKIIALRQKALVAALIGCALIQLQRAQAQEVSFTPRFDGVDQESNPVARPSEVQSSARISERKIYSFARFSGLFKAVCTSLRADFRERRVFEVGARGLEESGECGTCRALHRQIAQWCKPESVPRITQAIKETPTPTPIPSAAASPESEPDDGQQQDQGEAQGEQAKGESAAEIEEPAEPEEVRVPSEQQESAALENTEQEEEAPTPSPSPSPTPSPTPQPARYPSTELVDATSRLSQELYELEPGFGSTFDAVRKLAGALLEQQGLSPAERDYYSIFNSYLLSAWEGRPGSPLDPRVQAKEDVSELFQ